MKPERITSLSGVHAALRKMTSEHTTLFTSLVDNGKNHPYDCDAAQRRFFGSHKDDFPRLGKSVSPFDAGNLPSPEKLQELLIDDFRTAHDQHGLDGNLVSHNIKKDMPDNDNAGLKLLKSLIGTDNDTSGCVSLSYLGPSLEDICGDSKVDVDNTLRESMTVATVLESGTLLPLQHSNEGTTFTTLLYGAVAHIIWPPTEENLVLLRDTYQTCRTGTGKASMEVASKLQGGVCFVQTVGEAVRIPPFCPILCFSVDKSVLATYSVVTIGQVVGTLGKLPLLETWFETEIDGERKKHDFTTALLEQVTSILQGAFEISGLKSHRYPYSGAGPLHSLLQIWDDVKNDVARMLGAEDTACLMGTWEQFLRNARGRECWICGTSIQNKPRDMRKHFEAEHWPSVGLEGVMEYESMPQHTAESIITRLDVIEENEE